MNEESLGIRVIRFGIFELDLRARELRKNGLGLNLEAKPVDLLKLLVERAGQLVTRKELRQRLWPDSFVEFDRCINTAISKLRRALGDAIDSPRYIETRCRLGYRFIAPVDAADFTMSPGLPPLTLHARPTGQPMLIGVSAPWTPSITSLAAIANPRLDAETLRFQVKQPNEKLADLSLRLMTTKEGALNIRLYLCGAGFEEARQASGPGEAGIGYSYHADNSMLSLRRART